METSRGTAPCAAEVSFNFLASLINGNLFVYQWVERLLIFSSFNFLASLINGNPLVKGINCVAPHF